MSIFSVSDGALWLAYGALFVSIWSDPRVWSFGYHGLPCCRFCLNLGPVEIMVAAE